jgi:hypothetical protein
MCNTAEIETADNPMIHMDVPVGRLASLQQLIAKLNKKAVKWGLEEIIFLPMEERDVPVTIRDFDGEPYTVNVLCRTVLIVNPIPKINGWTLAARYVDVDGDGIPKVTVIEKMNTPELRAILETISMKVCEHCNVNRARKRGYVLFNEETGEYKQVGSTCIMDFLGSTRPEMFEKYFGAEAQLIPFAFDGELYEGNYANYNFTYPVVDIIAEAIAVCEISGCYVSRERAEENELRMEQDQAFNAQHLRSTTELVSDVFLNPRNVKRANGDHRAKAQEILEWCKTFVTTDAYDVNNQWMWKMMNIITRKENTSEIGIVASVIALYNRMTEVKQETNSQFVGEIKERRDFVLTLDRKLEKNGQFGTTYMFFCKDEDGNDVNVTSSNWIDWTPGETKTLKGTIKSHNDHPKFGKSTWINRVKIKEKENA